MNYKYAADDKMFFANSIGAFRTVLAEEGIDIEQLLLEVGIDSESLKREEPEISIERTSEFSKIVRKYSKDPAVMLKAGAAMNISTYGILGYAMMCSPTLTDAKRLAERYAEIIGDIFVTANHIEKDGRIIETYASAYPTKKIRIEKNPSAHDLNQATIDSIEIYLASDLTICRNLMGNDFCFQEIYLNYEDPGYREEYEKIFQCPIHFNHDRVMSVFDARFIKRALPLYNPITLNTCLKICEEFFSQQLNARSLTSKIRQILVNESATSLTLDGIAEYFDVSPRTLRRHLKEQGTSFQEIINSVRKDLAAKLLKDTTLSIEQIADKLRFSDAANFRNAFKRWTGTPPSSYRKQP